MVSIKSSPQSSRITDVKQEEHSVRLTPHKSTFQKATHILVHRSLNTDYKRPATENNSDLQPNTLHTHSARMSNTKDTCTQLSAHDRLSKTCSASKRKRDQDQDRGIHTSSLSSPQRFDRMKNSPADAMLDHSGITAIHTQPRDNVRAPSARNSVTRDKASFTRNVEGDDSGASIQSPAKQRTQRQSSVHTAPARLNRPDRAQSMGRTRNSEAARSSNLGTAFTQPNAGSSSGVGSKNNDDVNASFNTNNGSGRGVGSPAYMTATQYSSREYIERLTQQEKERERYRNNGAGVGVRVSNIHTRERRSMSQRPSCDMAGRLDSMYSEAQGSSMYAHGSSAGVRGRVEKVETHPYGEGRSVIKQWLGNVESFIRTTLAPLRWQGVWLSVALVLLLFGLIGLIRGLYNEVMANDGAFSSENIKVYLQACLYLSVVVAVIGCVVLTYERLNSAREERLAETRYMFQRVMDILERQGDAVQVHVRDEVCETNYNPLWADVVRRVSADSRVRSRKVCVGGVEQREWVWVAKQRRGGSMLPLSSVSGEALNASVLDASALGPATPLWSLNGSSDELNMATAGPAEGVGASSVRVFEDQSVDGGLGPNEEVEGNNRSNEAREDVAKVADSSSTQIKPSTNSAATGASTEDAPASACVQGKVSEVTNTQVAKDEETDADGAFSRNASLMDVSASVYQDPTNSLLYDLSVQ